MDLLVVLQAWHLKNRQTPENEEWVKLLHRNPLLAAVVMRETDFGQDTTRTGT